MKQKAHAGFSLEHFFTPLFSGPFFFSFPLPYFNINRQKSFASTGGG
jgi:hypothetical protein